jgi:hypothetical protein
MPWAGGGATAAPLLIAAGPADTVMAPRRTESSFGGPRAPTYATAFADQYQFLLASQESLADLNRRVAERDVYGLHACCPRLPSRAIEC